MKGNKKRNLITFLPVIGAAFILGMVLSWGYDSRSAKNGAMVRSDSEDVQKDPASSKAPNASDDEELTGTESEELGDDGDETVDLPDINISELQETNPDIVAWVTIPGTGVDYPIAQHPMDDEYYLKHDANGMYSSYGCPYIELDDSGSFLEFNTVVYGHNMNDGSMFASLHDFEDEDFFSEHRNIYIYTQEHCFTYKIFAAVMFDDRRIPYYYDDKLESDRTAYLQALKSDIVADRSVISNEIEVTEDNCIVTLSTCDKKLRDKRFLVVGVLTKIDGQEVG